MLKLLNIAREEIIYHARYWTFYIVTLGMPLLFAGLGAIPRIQMFAEDAPLPNVETVFTVDETISVPTGYVDYADLIRIVPAEQQANLRPFADETTAEAALTREEIDSYYVIASDYLTSGTVTQYSNNPQLLDRTNAPIRRLLQDNLLLKLDDPIIAARLDQPTNIVQRGPPQTELDILGQFDWQRLATAGLVMGLFAFATNLCGALLIRALQREIKARVLEVMVTSTTPTQFILGKTLGLATLALLQVSLALLAAAWVYGQNPDGSGPAPLPLWVVLAILPYLILGIAAYCGIAMSIAAIWPNPRESGMLLASARFIALSPAILVLPMLPDFDSLYATLVTTLFPPGIALLMTFRLLMTQIPVWQWLIGLLGLTLWATFTLNLSIRLFRARGLMTGKESSLRTVVQALRGR